MNPVHLAFFWHQHQPYYPDDVSGETLMPWVRLHGLKDYYGMALHIKEVPEFRCTINLVPSLLVQIQAYVTGGRSDRHLDLSRKPADGLTQADSQALLDQFFMANVDNMIRPHARYYELYQKRSPGTETSEKALHRFNERDLRDLQVWNNLTWFHEFAFELDSDLRAFRQKGKHWSEQEKLWLLEKQREILAQIIPLHQQLQAGGQVELTTTPFYHPILPLLWDKRCARQAMPNCDLPKALDPLRQDAQLHLDRAVALHHQLFGEFPTGMWPSEGSVSQDIIPAIAQTGVEWIATDEEILAHSTNGWVSRDAQGHMRNPEMLYRPWRVQEGDAQLQMVFRDHGLSDLIGFHYQRSQPVRAAGDLLGKIEGIGRGVGHNMGGRPALVPIILDGENCWEYYPDGGVEFLRTLYRECAQHPTIKPVRICDSLREYPATDRIQKLFAGSWISHNFAIWIGHHEDNTAWDLLHQTRNFLARLQETGAIAQEALTRAWEEIYIAEGSDWFWWFGDDHNSAQDDLFDQLFRKHLQNVYTLVGEPVPPQLTRPITKCEQRVLYTAPSAFLNVKVDGRRSYFEWLNAGHYVAGNERGTMALVTAGVIKELFFGFDLERLWIRLDTPGRAQAELEQVDELVIGFLEPLDYQVRIALTGAGATCELWRAGEQLPVSNTVCAVDQIVEISIPFADLGVVPEAPVHFYVECLQQRQSLDRVPREGHIGCTVPTSDFERIMWQA